MGDSDECKIYQADKIGVLTNPLVTFGSNTQIYWASKAEVTIDHNIMEHDTFDGTLLSTKSLPGGSLSLTRLTKHDDSTEKSFLEALQKFVPEDSENWEKNESERTVTLLDKRMNGQELYTFTGVLIEKFESTYEGEEVPEFNVDLKSEKVTVFAGPHSNK